MHFKLTSGYPGVRECSLNMALEQFGIIFDFSQTARSAFFIIFKSGI